jgi:Rhodopirellula transposase DDE domain
MVAYSCAFVGTFGEPQYTKRTPPFIIPLSTTFDHTPHAGVNQLLIFADGGGANGRRARAWKFNLQVKLCDPFQLTVTVCHYPPGCSKWNPIEYRLFSQISKNWEGIPLRTPSVMLGYIRGTTTTTGLTVKAYLDEGIYRKGQTVTGEESENLNVEHHETLPDWNYTIRPRS